MLILPLETWSTVTFFSPAYLHLLFLYFRLFIFSSVSSSFSFSSAQYLSSSDGLRLSSFGEKVCYGNLDSRPCISPPIITRTVAYRGDVRATVATCKRIDATAN